MRFYDRYRRVKLLLAALLILIALSAHFWSRRRPTPIDTRTELWEESMPYHVPVAYLGDAQWPAASPDHLRRWIAAKWVDWKSFRRHQQPTSVVHDYLRLWIALATVWTSPTPFVCLSRNRIEPLTTPWITYLSKLPERVEVVFWADTDHPGFVPRPILGKPRLPAGIVALRSAPADFQGVIVIRTRALCKKMFRLLPIAHNFEHTLCQVFRSFRASPLADTHPVPIHLTTSTRWRVVTYPRLNVNRFYDARSLRYWIRAPLSDTQLVEYFGHFFACMQHHHEAEWLLVHAEDYSAPLAQPMLDALDARLRTIPATVDALMLVYDRDQLPNLTGLDGHTTLHRLGYVEQPHLVLYRTQSIREKIYSLFPVLHPLGVALCTQWETYGMKP